MAIVQGRGEVTGIAAEMMIEFAKKGESVIVPERAFRNFANLAEEMVDACIGQLVDVGREVAETIAERSGAHPIRRTSSGLRSSDGASQQLVEAGSEEKLEVLDACQPIKGNARMNVGAVKKLENIEVNRFKPLALFLVGLAAVAFGIDDLL